MHHDRQMRHELAGVATLALLLLSLQLRPAAAGSMSLEAHSTDAGVVVHFSYVEDPAHPTGHPEWVGYTVQFCFPFLPLPNCPTGSGCTTIAQFPRSGGTDDFTFLYTVPPTLAGIEGDYAVYPSGASGQMLYLDPSACDPCAASDLAGWPLATTPAAVGTLEDLGWALRLNHCEFSQCGPTEVLVKEPWAAQLRPLAGSGQGVILYGEIGQNDPPVDIACCEIALDHYELWTCPSPPVPTRKTTWGQIKTIYH